MPTWHWTDELGEFRIELDGETVVFSCDPTPHGLRYHCGPMDRRRMTLEELRQEQLAPLAIVEEVASALRRPRS